VKIAYIIDHLRPDGTQRALQQLVEGLAERGHQQTMICLNDSWDALLVAALRRAATDVRFVGKAALVSGVGLLRIWHWLERGGYDVAVTLLFAADVLGRALARAAGVPRIVSSLRARNVHYAGWQRWLVRRTMPWADLVVLNSAHIRDFAIAEEGADPDRICVIPNGVEVERYTQPMSHAELRAEFGLSQDQVLVGSVGRLTDQKGFDLLVEALSLIHRQDVHLLLAGVGEEAKRLQAQAAGLNLEKRLHLAGYRRDVPRLLGALDLYVQPSRFEGMPNALLEAMAAGCATIATAVDGNRELIEDGVFGWLVAPEDSVALAQAMQAALDDRAEAQRRGAAARQRAIERFSTNEMVRAWEGLIEGAA